MTIKKSNGTPFSVWLGQLVIKVNNIPFKEWTQGYEDNLTIEETVKRYEEGHGRRIRDQAVRRPESWMQTQGRELEIEEELDCKI